MKRQPTLPVPPDMSEAMARAMQKLALEAENEEVEVVQEVDVFAHHEGVEVGPGGGRRGAVRPAPVARRSDPMAWSS